MGTMDPLGRETFENKEMLDPPGRRMMINKEMTDPLGRMMTTTKERTDTLKGRTTNINIEDRYHLQERKDKARYHL